MMQGVETAAKTATDVGSLVSSSTLPLYFAFIHSLPFVCCFTANEYKIITLQMCLVCSRVC